MNKKGITLIAVILLMTLLAVTAAGLIIFVIERLRLASIRQNEMNAYYMAQAGIYYSIYQYREDDIISGGYTGYSDRGFTWQIEELPGNRLSITSTGYSPASGANRIEKTLQANYNINAGRLTSLNYGN